MAQKLQLTKFSRLEFLTKILTLKYSKEVANKLTGAHRPSTRNQYQYCWSVFQEWLTLTNPPVITTSTILKFLIYLVEVKRVLPRTTTTYKNALRLPLLYGFGINTSSQPFKLLLNSQFIEHPPKRKKIPEWALNKVLSLLEMPQYSSKKATPHHIMSKSLFLIALASGNRVSEISAFDRDSVTFSNNMDNVTMAVRPGFLYKNERWNNVAPNVSIPSLRRRCGKPHLLCPVYALRDWLKASKSYEGPHLFYNMKTKKPLKTPQLSKLIVSLINSSQPNTFPKAHDVRKVASSLAWVRGIPIGDILKRSFWKSSNCFIERYLIPVKQNDNCIALGSK